MVMHFGKKQKSLRKQKKHSSFTFNLRTKLTDGECECEAFQPFRVMMPCRAGS